MDLKGSLWYDGNLCNKHTHTHSLFFGLVNGWNSASRYENAFLSAFATSFDANMTLMCESCSGSFAQGAEMSGFIHWKQSWIPRTDCDNPHIGQYVPPISSSTNRSFEHCSIESETTWARQKRTFSCSMKAHAQAASRVWCGGLKPKRIGELSKIHQIWTFFLLWNHLFFNPWEDGPGSRWRWKRWERQCWSYREPSTIGHWREDSPRLRTLGIGTFRGNADFGAFYFLMVYNHQTSQELLFHQQRHRGNSCFISAKKTRQSVQILRVACLIWSNCALLHAQLDSTSLQSTYRVRQSCVSGGSILRP